MPTASARRCSRRSRQPARSPPHRAPRTRPGRPASAPVGRHPGVARTQTGADCPWSWGCSRRRSRACRPRAAPRPARAGWSGRARCGPRRDDRQDAPRASARRFHASPDRMTAGTGHRPPGPRRSAAARHPMRRSPGRALPAAADRRRTTAPQSHPDRTAGRLVPVASPVARLPPAARSPARSRGHRPAARRHCRSACSGQGCSSPACSPQAHPRENRPAAPRPPAAPERCLPASSSPARSDEGRPVAGLPPAGLPACSLGNQPVGQGRFRPACSGPAHSRATLPARRTQAAERPASSLPGQGPATLRLWEVQSKIPERRDEPCQGRQGSAWAGSGHPPEPAATTRRRTGTPAPGAGPAPMDRTPTRPCPAHQASTRWTLPEQRREQGRSAPPTQGSQKAAPGRRRWVGPAVGSAARRRPDGGYRRQTRRLPSRPRERDARAPADPPRPGRRTTDAVAEWG
jgi:hypothetical protein